MSKELTPETPADVLNSHIDDYISKPHSDKTGEDHDFIKDVIGRQSTSPESISKLYSHLAPPDMDHADIDEDHDSVIEDIAAAPNTPVDVLHDIALKGNKWSSLLTEDHPAVDPQVLETRAQRDIDAGKPNVTRNLRPEFYETLINKRKTASPEEQGNIDKVLSEYGSTRHHTPESIERAVSLFEKGPISDQNDFALERLVEKQNLSKDQLNRLHNAYNGVKDHEDSIKEIVKHHNADPTLLAKIAKDADHSEQDTAISHPNLPPEVLQSIVNKPDLDYAEKRGLENNPNLSSTQIDQLVSNGHRDFLSHDNASPDSIKKHWDSTTKGTSDARELLGMPNTPPEVLKELVNHKNKGVAIDALKHQNVDQDIVNTALSRKAADVNEAAKNHPLAGKGEFIKEFKTGKRDLWNMYTNKKAMDAWDSMSPEDKQTSLMEHHKIIAGNELSKISKDSKQDKASVIRNKAFLIGSPELPQSVRDSHTQDLSEMFSQIFPKNMEMKDSWKQEDYETALHQNISSLLSKGNKIVENELLSHPGFIHDMKSDLNASPSFMDRAYEADKKNHASNMQIYDSNGIPSNYKSNVKNIIKNQNTSIETTKKIAKSNPEVLDEPSWAGSEPDKTWLSEKIEDLPEQEKIKHVDELIKDSNGGAANLIIASKEVPAQTRQSLWNNLTPIEKLDLVKANSKHFSLSDLGDINIKKQALNGEYNNVINEKTLDPFQRSVIKGLSPKNDSDTNLLKDSLNSFSSQKVSDTLNLLPMEFKQSEKMLDIAQNGSGHLVHQIAASYLLATESGTEEHAKSSFLKIKDLIYSKANEIQDQEAKAEYINDQWRTLLSQNKITEIAKRAGHIFDDLIDAVSYQLHPTFGRALEMKGLLSPQKLQELDSQKKFEDRIATMSPVMKHNFIAERLLSGELSPDDTVEAYKQFIPSEYIDKSVDDLDQKTETLLNVYKNAPKKTDYISSIFSTDDSTKNQFLSDITNKLYTETESLNLPDEEKASIQKKLLDESFATLGKVKAVKDLASTLVDKFIQTQNGDDLFNVQSTIGLAPAQQKQLIDMLQNNPNAFGIHTLSNGIGEYANSDGPTKIGEAFINTFDKIAQNQASIGNHKPYQTIFTKLSQTNTDDQKRLQTISTYLKKNTLSEDPIVKGLADKHLAGMIQSNLPDEEKNKIFQQLDNTTQTADNIDYSFLDCNHPDVLESMTGAKLSRFIARDFYETLNDKSIDIITNRVLLDESLDLGHKISVFEGLSTHPLSSKEALAKIGRAIPHKYFSKQINNIYKKSWNDHGKSENSLNTQLHGLVESKIADLDKLMTPTSDPTSPYYNNAFSDDHLHEISTHITPLAEFVGGTFFDESATNIKEKAAVYSKIYETLDKHFATILNNAENKDYASLYVSNATVSLMNSRLDMSKNDIQHLSNLISLSKGAKYQFKMKAFANVLDRCKGLTKEDWEPLFEQNPEFHLTLEHMSEIDSPLMETYDFNKSLGIDEGIAINGAIKMVSKMEGETLFKYGKDLLIKAMKVGSEHLPPKEVDKAFESLGANLSYDDLRSITDQYEHGEKSYYTIKALNHGVGGERLYDEYAKSGNSHNLLESPYLKEIHANKAIKEWTENLSDTDNIKKICSNYKAPQKSLDSLVDILIDNHKKGYKSFSKQYSSEIAALVLAHPGISKESVESIYKETAADKELLFLPKKQFHPAFANPTWGGQLMRKLPPGLPEQFEEHVNKDNLVKSISVAPKDADLLQATMTKIPAEGISWPDFKRQNPSLENNKSIKNIFMAKNNKPVVPEDFVKALSGAEIQDKQKEYHMTYSVFDMKLQQHNNKPSLVFQLNNSEKTEKELTQDPKLWSLYQLILKESNGITGSSIGLHPTTPQMNAWSRVDVSSGNQGWIIEEFQNDVAQKFRKHLRGILKNSPSGIRVDGHKITPNELRDYMKKIDSHLDDWAKASMEAVIQNAKAQGVKRLYMHGSGIRSFMSGGANINGQHRDYNKDHINPRIVEIYDGTAQKHGFTKVDYRDYPKTGKETLNGTQKRGLSTHCWALSLDGTPIEEPTEIKPVKPKRTKKA